MFTPGTEMSKLCADVTVMNKNAIAPHRHSIPTSSSPSATGVSVAPKGRDPQLP